MLKEKLVQVKNELADATQQLLKLNNETAAYKRNLEESSGARFLFYFSYSNANFQMYSKRLSLKMSH